MGLNLPWRWIECGSIPVFRQMNSCRRRLASLWAGAIASSPMCSCSIPGDWLWPTQWADWTITPSMIAATEPCRPSSTCPERVTRKLWPESTNGGWRRMWSCWMALAYAIASARLSPAVWSSSGWWPAVWWKMISFGFPTRLIAPVGRAAPHSLVRMIRPRKGLPRRAFARSRWPWLRWPGSATMLCTLSGMVPS